MRRRRGRRGRSSGAEGKGGYLVLNSIHLLQLPELGHASPCFPPLFTSLFLSFFFPPFCSPDVPMRPARKVEDFNELHFWRLGSPRYAGLVDAEDLELPGVVYVKPKGGR